MKYKLFILIISLAFSDVFKEFDKSFLFNEPNLNIEYNWSEQAQYNFISNCSNNSSQNSQSEILKRIDFCKCVMNDFMVYLSEEEFINELIYIQNNQKVSNNLKTVILTSHTDCISEFIEELIEKKQFGLSHDSTNSATSNDNAQSEITKEGKAPSEKKKPNKNSFEEKIKGYDKIEGLFNFYIKENENKALMEIKPEQLEVMYLASYTRQSGDAHWFDGSSMMGEFPIMFKKVGKTIQAIEVNVKFRADKNLAINKALENHISNSIVANSKILSEPNKDTGAYLIDASNFFISDIGNLSQMKGIGFKFDKSNSYYNYIKSFPENVEIDVSIHYVSSKPKYKFTLADSGSMIHKYHISISEIPDSNYSPRLADDRLGHFMTMHQDYSNTFSESPYVRYINRWDLKKKHPELSISEPVEPIVFWIENTVPHEFRAPIREGIEKWNLAFESIGFKNAIIAKQMPDNADWDPADTRYNTIRWMIQPGNAYAVGPSRANPLTGELYDADIRIGSDFLRFYYTDFVEFIDPIQMIAYEDSIYHNSHDCHYHDLMKHKMTYGWNYLTATNQIKNSKKEMEQFVYEGLVDLILHEVGHTLGLRHNFKSSSIYSIEEISDSKFTEQYGITGSVMDYNATNLFDGGNNYFQTVPGPYDYWAIEYAYSEQPPYSREKESDFLEKIASKSTEPMLAYGTDEDAGSRGIDPYTNRRDMTSDPIKHYEKRIDIGNKFIDEILDNFENEGDRYPKIRSVFFQGFYEYYGAARSIAKFIGGIKHSRHHIGQKYDEYPLEVIDVSIQNQALNFYKNYIFDKNNFNYDQELLNKMAPERLRDFEGNLWKMNRLDFPIHSIIKNIQNTSLYNLFSPKIHNRIIDNKTKVSESEIFELDYLFSEITQSIWEELDNQENINSFRRQLQTLHINYLHKMYDNEKGDFPDDSQSLSRLHLGILSQKIEKVVQDPKPYNDYTLAHLLKSFDTINEVLDLE